MNSSRMFTSSNLLNIGCFHSYFFYIIFYNTYDYTIIFKCERMDSNVLCKKKYIENRYIILASPLP